MLHFPVNHLNPLQYHALSNYVLAYANVGLLHLPIFSSLLTLVTMKYIECAGQVACINFTARKNKSFSLEASGKNTLEALKSRLVLLLLAKNMSKTRHALDFPEPVCPIGTICFYSLTPMYPDPKFMNPAANIHPLSEVVFALIQSRK